jgi:hypothetical protein
MEHQSEARSDYKRAWQELRRLRLYAALLWLSFLPFTVIMFKVMAHHPTFGQIALFIPIVLGWVLLGKFNTFRCPRCGVAFDPLGSMNAWANSWGKRCARCGLAKWSQGSEGPDKD